jgi:D-beta-D-heptose 7-phosphate kinase/D-beta-D-heptose 1-phosphate adenosyltransferase
MKRVWINGCFDILHRGHYEMFAYAYTIGDEVKVGIDSDDKVKKDKGKDRPYNSLEDRLFALNSIKYIDFLTTFNSKEELENKIKKYQPDILLVGSDWKEKEIVGGQYAREIIYFDRVGNYSTTNILEYDSTT